MENEAGTSSTMAADDRSDFGKKLANGENTPLLTEKSETFYDTTRLSKSQKFAFGLGHVINDIMGVLWFSYALAFLQIIVRLQPTISAGLLLLGQSVDAIATPFIGILIDRFGTKKRWNALGATLTATSFPFIFHVWRNSSSILYYAIAVVIFQLGWATVQISHLSLITDMTIYLQERAELTTLRYTIFVCSNILIYIMAYFILQESKRGNRDIIEPRDGWKFEIIALIAVLVGLFCTTLFQSALRSPATEGTVSKAGNSNLTKKLQSWKKMLSICCSSKLYLVAFVHTTSRVFHSLNLVYVPFFVNETNVRNSGILATAPLFNFAAALITSMFINSSSSKLHGNNKFLFSIGTAFSLLNCVCIYLNPDRQDNSIYIQAAAVFCGIGSAMTIVTSLCIAANFIGDDTAYGAFTYGLITFSDKILNGVMIFIIEYLKRFDFVSDEHYYKFVLTFVNGILAAGGYLFLMLLPSSVCYST